MASEQRTRAGSTVVDGTIRRICGAAPCKVAMGPPITAEECRPALSEAFAREGESEEKW